MLMFGSWIWVFLAFHLFPLSCSLPPPTVSFFPFGSFSYAIEVWRDGGELKRYCSFGVGDG